MGSSTPKGRKPKGMKNMQQTCQAKKHVEEGNNTARQRQGFAENPIEHASARQNARHEGPPLMQKVRPR
eukprot:1031568-Karenia_brevis.AAC.1